MLAPDICLTGAAPGALRICRTDVLSRLCIFAKPFGSRQQGPSHWVLSNSVLSVWLDPSGVVDYRTMVMICITKEYQIKIRQMLMVRQNKRALEDLPMKRFTCTFESHRFPVHSGSKWLPPEPFCHCCCIHSNSHLEREILVQQIVRVSRFLASSEKTASVLTEQPFRSAAIPGLPQRLQAPAQHSCSFSDRVISNQVMTLASRTMPSTLTACVEDQIKTTSCIEQVPLKERADLLTTTTAASVPALEGKNTNERPNMDSAMLRMISLLKLNQRAYSHHRPCIIILQRRLQK